MAVTVRGYISVYERDGNYQLYAEEMEPAGVGALYLAFEQLKEKLQREGLFAADRKRTIPLMPRQIALVTSPTGAALRDMLKIINRRWPLAKVIIVPVLVQGANAPADICRGIEQINHLSGVDVMIVGRGGGSLEELWAFNTESVARAMAASSIPVISAVGHQTDVTITDFVADARAATPSAAAEMVVPDQQEVKRYVEILKERCQRAVRQQVDSYRIKLKRLNQSQVLQNPRRLIIDGRQQYVDMLAKELQQKCRLLLTQKGSRLGELAASIQSLSPLSTLARGYSLCLEPNGQLIKSSKQVEIGDNIRVILDQGELQCTINDKKFT
jgi:exodeoxyribonuclease VII large subunit